MTTFTSKLSRLLGDVGLAGGQLEDTVRDLLTRWRSRRKPLGAIWRIIQLFGEAYPNAVFVLIGANDGMALDPLREQRERGLHLTTHFQRESSTSPS